jgi:hypothetical protein
LRGANTRFSYTPEYCLTSVEQSLLYCLNFYTTLRLIFFKLLTFFLWLITLCLNVPFSILRIATRLGLPRSYMVPKISSLGQIILWQFVYLHFYDKKHYPIKILCPPTILASHCLTFLSKIKERVLSYSSQCWREIK